MDVAACVHKDVEYAQEYVSSFPCLRAGTNGADISPPAWWTGRKSTRVRLLGQLHQLVELSNLYAHFAQWSLFFSDTDSSLPWVLVTTTA